MPLQMNELMKSLLARALADGTPCLLGTVGDDGRPQISPKGSMAVFDNQTLSYWERSFRGAYQHLQHNPHVVIFYRNYARAAEMPYRSGALRFHGRARIVAEGPERERAWELAGNEERERDPGKKGIAVLIDVDKIEELSGAVVMLRDNNERERRVGT